MDNPFEVDWSGLEDELKNVPELISSTFQSSTNFTNIELLDNLNDSIIHSAYYLLRGYPLETEVASSKLFGSYFSMSNNQSYLQLVSD